MSPEQLFAKLSGSIFVVEVANQASEITAQGSAVAIGGSRLVTNKHVVVEGEKLLVAQRDKIWAARVLQLSPNFDLCLLDVQGLVRSPPAVRSVRNLAVGERVYAIGAPRGLELTLSDGLVSGIRIDQGESLIQTSAPISPGSSGGGLFDSAGQLVGVTTFTLTQSQQLNFAVPAERIEELIDQSSGETAVAWVGAGDEFVSEAHLHTFEPPPSDPAAQSAWTRQMQQEIRPLQIKWQKAVHAYREALALMPEDAETWLKLGETYSDLGAKAEATAAFQRAAALRPDNLIRLGRNRPRVRNIGR